MTEKFRSFLIRDLLGPDTTSAPKPKMGKLFKFVKYLEIRSKFKKNI